MQESGRKPQLLLALPLTAAATAHAASAFELVPTEGKGLRMSDLLALAETHEAEGVIIAPSHRFDAAALSSLSASVRVLATISVGFDHIDVAAAAARGIIVTNTPDVVTDATADITLLLILGAFRRAREHVLNMEAGWSTRNGFADGLGWEVTGKRLGVVGMGRIGRAVAQRARGFRMPIFYHNRTRLPPDLEHGATYVESIDTLLPQCDVLSLNLPGGQGVLMTAERFAQMRRGAVFINTARGGLVDEAALIAALQSGHLAAAGLDVFASEPNFNRELLTCPTAFLLPHVGSATIETRDATAMRALDNVTAVLSGRTAPDAVGA